MKTKFALLAVLISFAVVTLLSSCDKSMDEPLMPVVASEQQIDNSMVTTRTDQLMDSRSWSSVSNTIKNRYYNAYQHASRYSYTNVENNPVPVGFYAAFNAIYNEEYGFLVGDLQDLCGMYTSRTKFKSYYDSPDEFSDFKAHIRSFVTNKARPVVIYAKSQPWTNLGIEYNALTVWAVSDGYVRVTKISDRPNQTFGYNNIIELSWQQLFNKAIEISAVDVANVAFMDSRIY